MSDAALETPPVKPRSVRGRLPSGEPNPVDVHLGKRLRMRPSARADNVPLVENRPLN